MYKAIRYIIYSASLALAVVSCHQPDTLFASLPASSTHIDFQNNPAKKELFNILYYLYYYNGGGVAIGDINNDGLPDIYFSANSKGNNKLYLNKGDFQFEDITDKAGVAGSSDWCTGVTMADINGDGLLDIYVCAYAGAHHINGRNELFINNGNGTFTESAAKYGLDFSGFGTQAVFFDYDHDGDLDCYLLNQSQQPHANIKDTANRRAFDPLAGDRLLRNDVSSTGKFTDVSASAGIYQSNLGYGLGISVADFNNDGWDDIYIGNDFHENDYYYLNNGNGTFTESGAKHFNHYSRFSMGNDAADVNNDGQMDLFTADMLPPDEKILKTYGSDENPDMYRVKLTMNGYQDQYSRNCLQRNNGDGSSFSDVGLQAGVAATDWSWCPLFADFDNDGNKDLFVSSGIVKRPVDLDYILFEGSLKSKGMNKTDKYDEQAINAMPDGSSHPFLFQGSGALGFKDRSDAWGTGHMKGYYNGAAYADLNNDGRLDMVINSLGAPAVILKNNAPPKNFISIAFKGEGMNRFGIGAKAWLFTAHGMQYQELMLTRGFESSSEPKLHFGLDTLAAADSLLIVWPGQSWQVLKNIPSGTRLNVEQKNASGIFDYHRFFPSPAPAFEDVSNSTPCNWKHKENDFVDFNSQYLIPHKESTRGPKIAVGDVNKDGLDDFYACGAKGQAGVLMIQQKNGGFLPSDTALFARYAICEDVDALFFDANGDGYPDLWVVSGGNETPENELASADRLYMNDGKGHLTIAANAFTPLAANKSCIAAADIDHDGDMDVFIGNLSAPGKYGLPQSSLLYINDGRGRFSLDSNKLVNLAGIGMVTAASFTDLNKDGWPDLVVTGEWMPVKIFMNNKGRFVEADIPASTGLWQTVYTTDVNGDGYPDILAGNWGHNSKLWSGKDGPLKLYVKDFDNNGSLEQIMCYTVNGKEYTFLAKDELERALPVLKKAYLSYREVAGQTVQYVFYDLFKDYTGLKAEVLGSSCFINDRKGGYKRMDLPEELQLAPIFAFQPVTDRGSPAYMAVGNFYGVVPYEGRYDALYPGMAAFDGKTGAFQSRGMLNGVGGEFRDAKWISYGAAGKRLVLARNNGALVFLKPKS